jgi:pimeloyl-ACP methyl ester carboxylesterase
LLRAPLKTADVLEAETRYAKSGDVHVAYQVSGDGPFDIVFVPGFVSHVEIETAIPGRAAFFERVGSFARLIRFDKRGTGMSDRVGGAPTLEARMDDVRAVMDAVGSRRAAFYGVSEGAAMCLLFAATYPERTAALMVRSAYPRRMWATDYPWGLTEQDYERELARDLRIFGSRAQATDAVRVLGRFEGDELQAALNLFRFGSSPGAVEALHRMNKEIDVRHVLSAVRVPTLILRGSEDTLVPAGVTQYMASRIPAARIVEIPGAGHLALGGEAAMLIADEVEQFLTQVWDAGGWADAEPDRILATVLFTDVVGSTERAVTLGDRAWRGLLERHHALIRRELVRFRGAELDVAGDGFFARFDGPARAVRCACAITDAMGELGLEIRAGLHTGECEVVDGKVGGIAVHIGARVAKQASPGEVLVSSTVKDLVAGSGLAFDERGTTELKGVPDEWRLYAVAR